jgi:predicted nucleic acid-binding protein
MLVISDTNILSSLAAGEALALLFRLFSKTTIYIPLAVQQELQIGLDKGKIYLEQVEQAIATGKIQVLHLSIKEQTLASTLPDALNPGECQAIAIAQQRQGRLLSNDKKAVNYCLANHVKVANLADLLREFWLRGLISTPKIKRLIQRMEEVERLRLSSHDYAKIFTPRHINRR